MSGSLHCFLGIKFDFAKLVAKIRDKRKAPKTANEAATSMSDFSCKIHILLVYR